MCQLLSSLRSTLLSTTGVIPADTLQGYITPSHMSVTGSHMLHRYTSPVTTQWQCKHRELEKMLHCSLQAEGLVGDHDTLSLLVITLRHLNEH